VGRSPAHVDRLVRQPFSFHAAPPYLIEADALLRDTLRRMPAGMQPASPHFELDLLTREIRVLTVHAFWYTYCALLQDDSHAEQTALLRLMALEVARLMGSRRMASSSFFEHASPLVALAVVSALRTQAGLFLTSNYIHSIFKHLIALFGCRPAQAQLAQWLAHASATSGSSSRPSSPTHRSRFGALGKPAPLILEELLSGAMPADSADSWRGGDGHRQKRKFPKGVEPAGTPREAAALDLETARMAPPLAGWELPVRAH